MNETCTAGELRGTRKRRSFVRFVVAALLISIGSFVVGVSGASAADYSKWIKNLSAVADPDRLYLHSEAKVVTSGNFVHVMWVSFKLDWTGKKIFYARSINGGKSFQTPVALVSGDPSVIFPAEWKNLAAGGPYVHVIYAYGWPRNMVYLRSQDNGATFQEPVTLFSSFATYNGAYIAAQKNKVALVWDSNNGYGAQPKDIICDYSIDGGATFVRTQMAHSEGTSIYNYCVHDAVRSGDFLYVLTSTTDENWYTSQQHLYLWASTNGGATFKTPVKVNVKATNGGYYVGTVQAADYSPNLAASGKEVNVVWINVDDPGSFDGWAALTLRVRKSSNAGTSLADPIVLHTFPPGYPGTHGANSGLETIVRKGQDVYVSTVISSGDPGTFLWRSVDGGATWSAARQISHGGWWPLVTTDPLNPGRIHLFNSSYFRSDDAGDVFDGGVNPKWNIGTWTYPQLAIDSKGIPHYVWGSGNYAESAILYRRLAPVLVPVLENKAVSLKKNSLYGPPLSDHLQIPATPAVNFTSALTVEFMVKRRSDDASYFQELINKKRTSGMGSYMIGAWSGMTVYSRLVTDATDPYYGAFLGTTEVLAKNKWTHVAMTYDANTAVDNWKIYVNGVLAAKTTITGLIQTETPDSPLVIGSDSNSGADGSVAIDELRLWNSARTQSEIMADMERRLTGTEAGLMSYYNFDNTFEELTGHGEDALPMYHEAFVTGPLF